MVSKDAAGGSRRATRERSTGARPGCHRPSLLELASPRPVRCRRTSAEGLRALAAHPLLPNLKTLEIWTTDAAKSFPFEELFKLRPRLAHLERILLGGHLVPEAMRERLAAWPAVELVSHDRREVLAFDLAALGWARALR